MGAVHGECGRRGPVSSSSATASPPDTAWPGTQSVPSLIQARLDSGGYRYEVVNAGVSGDTSAGGLSRLDWSLSGDVQILVVELGANDGLRGLPVAAMKSNLDQIIRRARQRGITVLLTGMEAPPNYGAAYTREFRQVFHDLAPGPQDRLHPVLSGWRGGHSVAEHCRRHPSEPRRRAHRRSHGLARPATAAREATVTAGDLLRQDGRKGTETQS